MILYEISMFLGMKVFNKCISSFQGTFVTQKNPIDLFTSKIHGSDVPLNPLNDLSLERDISVSQSSLSVPPPTL